MWRGFLLYATGVGETGLRERVLLAACLAFIVLAIPPWTRAKEQRTEVVDTQIGSVLCINMAFL